MYADNTSLAYSVKNADDISNVMNYKLESLRKCLYSNKLSLNVAKTSKVIGTRNALQDKSNGKFLRTNFNTSEELIELMICVKYLGIGIQISSQLKWKEHVASLSLEVPRATKMIKYVKRFLLTETLKWLYCELIETHLRFCWSVWGNFGVRTRKKFLRDYNRSVRIIKNSQYDAPT